MATPVSQEFLQNWDLALAILGSAGTLAETQDRDLVQASGVTNPWLIAAELADLFALRAKGTGGITEFTSEGASFKKTSSDWEALASGLRAKAGVPGSDGQAFVVSGASPLPPPELVERPWLLLF